jgi:hypothetical protein
VQRVSVWLYESPTYRPGLVLCAVIGVLLMIWGAVIAGIWWLVT